jgi:hypothetical protein
LTVTKTRPRTYQESLTLGASFMLVLIELLILQVAMPELPMLQPRSCCLFSCGKCNSLEKQFYLESYAYFRLNIQSRSTHSKCTFIFLDLQ